MARARKASGGKIRPHRKKRKYEIKKFLKEVKLGERKIKRLRVRGGNTKVVLLQDNVANVCKDGKVKKVKILDVLATPSNPLLARSKLLMKGAIIKTELGKAKITNRPGQEGFINAVLIE
ncbi:MAG: 30S ribosomal protein S8e [Candidatus Pacearchaeota archaeon]